MAWSKHGFRPIRARVIFMLFYKCESLLLFPPVKLSRFNGDSPSPCLDRRHFDDWINSASNWHGRLLFAFCRHSEVIFQIFALQISPLLPADRFRVKLVSSETNKGLIRLQSHQNRSYFKLFFVGVGLSVLKAVRLRAKKSFLTMYLLLLLLAIHAALARLPACKEVLWVYFRLLFYCERLLLIVEVNLG